MDDRHDKLFFGGARTMSVLYGAIGGAIAGALGGAVGWGLSALIWADRDPADRSKWLSALCLAAAVALSRPIINWWETPSVDDALTQAQHQFPALAALKSADPSEYSDVRATLSQVQSGSMTQRDGMERVHAAVMRAFQRKLPTAPDAIVQVEAQIAGAEYAALQGTPDICVNYIAGTEVVDLRQYLTPNMVAADQDMIARVLRAQPIQRPTIASEAEVQKAAEPIILRIVRDEGVSGPQIVNALQVKGDPRLICRVYAALFQHISELPTPQAAAVTRGIFRMGEKSS